MTPSPPSASWLSAQVEDLEAELAGLMHVAEAHETELKALREEKAWAENEIVYLEKVFYQIRTRLDDAIAESAEIQMRLDAKTVDCEGLEKDKAAAKAQAQALRHQCSGSQALVQELQHRVSLRDRQIGQLVDLLRSKTLEAQVCDIALASSYAHFPVATERETLRRLVQRSRKAIRPQLVNKMVRQMLQEVDGPLPISLGTDPEQSTAGSKDAMNTSDKLDTPKLHKELDV